MGQPDAELVRRWQGGDAAAFEALVRRWQEPVARFLARLVGPHGPVTDLCQDTFLRAYLAGTRYRDNGSFSTWLFQIALNAARDHGRRSARRPQPLPGGEMPVPADAEDQCQRRELAEAVARAVAELPPPLREVLALRHDRGMNFEAMARLLGVPASTLKSRFAVALRRLHTRLSELGWGAEETLP